MPSRKADLAPDSLEPLILVIRSQRVILDTDLARLYGVSTKRFNEASNETNSGSLMILHFNLRSLSSTT